LWLRTCSVQLQALGGKVLELSDLRCRFHITQVTVNTPSVAILRITNQNPTTAQQLVKPSSEFTTLQISAGYQDEGMGVIFLGNVTQIIYGRENPTDTLTTIMAGDGHQFHNYAKVHQTLPAGSTPKDMLNAAMTEASKYGVSLGYIASSIDLTVPKSARAIMLMGMARHVIFDIARSKQAYASYSRGKLNMLKKDDNAPGAPVKLNSETGMVGMPTQEIGGIMVRSLINPKIQINGLVQINQADIQKLPLTPIIYDGNGNAIYAPQSVDLAQIAADGIYRVYKIEYDGDTRGEPWYMDMACLKQGQNTSQSLATPGFSNPA